MILNNKYSKIYYQIIDQALTLNRTKQSINDINYLYLEEHHILPKSIGGDNSTENLVLLTPREHFICHYLLCKMFDKNTYEWHKMVRAFTFMFSASNNQKRYINSKMYELARKNIGYIMSQSQSGEKNSQYGTTWVSHLEKRHCLRIDNSILDEYISNGYIKKRVVSWDIYDKNMNLAKSKEIAKLKLEISKMSNKISIIENQKKILELELASLEGLEPSPLVS